MSQLTQKGFKPQLRQLATSLSLLGLITEVLVKARLLRSRHIKPTGYRVAQEYGRWPQTAQPPKVVGRYDECLRGPYWETQLPSVKTPVEAA